MDQQARIAFAGTPQFAVPSLEALLSAGFDVSLVLTQPDRPAGRGRRLAPSAVKSLAVARGLRLRQPARLPKDPVAAADWGAAPDVLVVAAYGLLLPQWLLDWPRLTALNLHASLLPRWRGAAPIQSAILAGDRETGISVMQMALGLDEGPVFMQRRLTIGADETAGELNNRLADLAAVALLEALPGVIAGTAEATPQNHAEACYAPKIKKSDSRLDWRESAVALQRKIRAFNPWPIADAMLGDGRVMRIHEAAALDVPVDAAPGGIVAESPSGIDVATGAGVLRITRLQLPGARAMSAEAFLNAHHLEGLAFDG